MKMERCKKESFTVIGKEGSTSDGEGFIQKLWDDANSHSFKLWEDFCRGLYLAGVECNDGAEAPAGWTKWVIPAYEYIYVECEDENTFSSGIKYLEDNNIPLVGAVHDFTCPQTGKNYMFFPIRRL